jgi:hypothetical protein
MEFLPLTSGRDKTEAVLMGGKKGTGRAKFRVIDGNPNAPSNTSYQSYLARQARRQPPLVKAAVMGSQRPDVAPVGEGGERYFTELNVAQMAGVSGRELRRWVAACPFLQPIEGATMRVYRVDDARLVLEIRYLVRDRGLTIEEARFHIERRLGIQSAPEL